MIDLRRAVRTGTSAAAALLVVSFAGTAARAEWTAEKLATIEGFQTPECVVVDPATGTAYVSNVARSGEGDRRGSPWDEDRNGFISRLEPGGKLDALRWQASTAEFRVDSPKGMCVLGDGLWVADVRRMLRLPTGGGRPAKAYPIAKAERLNDMVAEGSAVYVSDTAAGKVYRFARQGRREIKAPEGANGITFHLGRMFGVSWTAHEIYQLDPAGEDEPQPFGLAEQFKSLDGIEVLDDGTFLVSDFLGNRVAAIGPDRKSASTLIETDTPADIGLDRQRSLLYVPCFLHDRVEVYELKKGSQ